MDADQLHERRAGPARKPPRRRRAAIGALCVAAIVAIAAVATLNGGGTPGAGGAGTPRAGGAGARQSARVSRSVRSGRRAPTRRAGGSSTAAALGPGTGPPGRTPVPVLMYHVIAPPPPGAPFPGLYVEPREFAAQMRALKASGWRAVTLDQLRAHWSHGSRLPRGRPIVITFDNGYRSQFTAALPVLRRAGWVADENIQLSGLPPSQGGLTTGQVRGLVHAGWELDTQGISHADLVTLNASQLHYEIAVARQIIRRRFGVPVNWFCYPSGHYDPTVIAAVRAAGFVGSTTVIPGWASPADDLYRLPRLRVLGGTTPVSLLAQIAGARTSSAPPGAYGKS